MKRISFVILISLFMFSSIVVANEGEVVVEEQVKSVENVKEGFEKGNEIEKNDEEEVNVETIEEKKEVEKIVFKKPNSSTSNEGSLIPVFVFLGLLIGLFVGYFKK